MEFLVGEHKISNVQYADDNYTDSYKYKNIRYAYSED